MTEVLEEVWTGGAGDDTEGPDVDAGREPDPWLPVDTADEREEDTV